MRTIYLIQATTGFEPYFSTNIITSYTTEEKAKEHLETLETLLSKWETWKEENSFSSWESVIPEKRNQINDFINVVKPYDPDIDLYNYNLSTYEYITTTLND